MQTPHFELMENDQIYDDCHLLISKTNENIVEDSVFYRLIKLTHSDQYQYFYVISTNSYIPSLV